MEAGQEDDVEIVDTAVETSATTAELTQPPLPPLEFNQLQSPPAQKSQDV